MYYLKQMVMGRRSSIEKWIPDPSVLPGQISPHDMDTILSLVSIAENSQTTWWNNYNYAENIGDGRGITVGVVGFCTGTGDLVQVFDVLSRINPKHAMLRFHGALRAIDKRGGGSDTKGLDGFEEEVHKLGEDKDWIRAQWIVLAREYINPAFQQCVKHNAKSNFAFGFLFDIALNHGPDRCKMFANTAAMQAVKEKDFLSHLITVRTRAIQSFDRDTNDGQTDRCKMWRSILDTGNLRLQRPLKNLVCYGDKFQIL